MTRKVLVLVFGALVLLAAGRPAGAQQYPPTSGEVGVTVTVGVGVEGAGANAGGSGVLGGGLEQGGGGDGGGGGALARTGLDAGPALALGVGLVATGIFAVVGARRRSRSRLGAV